MQALRAVAHPTDFSQASAQAFAHALRIALTAKCPLSIMHVSTDAATDDWASYPHVRHTLAQWGLMDERDSTAAIEQQLGIKVVKVELMPMETVRGILHFLHDHPADLMVLSTEGRQAVARWLHEALSRASAVPTLFVPAKAQGFVDAARGEMHLRRVLIPVTTRQNRQRPSRLLWHWRNCSTPRPKNGCYMSASTRRRSSASSAPCR